MGDYQIQMKKWNDGIKFLVFLVIVFSLLAKHSDAATIDFGPNGCTLQDAIRSANNDNDVGNCAAGSGTDVLVGPDAWMITLNSRLPTITSDLTITTATTSGFLTLDGDYDSAIMKITGTNTDVDLERILFTKGSTSSIRGAAIHIEDASVEISNSSFSFNRSTGRYGGAIYVKDGNLSVSQSSFGFNTILNTESNTSYGGAIYGDDSIVTITDSAFYDNRARYSLNSNGSPFGNNVTVDYLSEGRGWSVSVNGGNLNINRSTFNDNNRSVHGRGTVAEIVNSTFNRLTPLGWIDNWGHIFFTESSALTLNHVTVDAAILITDSILNMTNTIILGECNIAPSTSWIIDEGNLYDTPFAFQQDVRCKDEGNLFYEPRLLSLNNYGGFTDTFKLHYNSDAINAGDPFYCTDFDQRGVARGDVCDIGAYEAADLIDVQVSSEIFESAPYVHNQVITYLAKIKNDSSSVLDEVRVNLSSDNAVIIDVDFFQCMSFPCILNGIQPQQEIIIPVTYSLDPFQSDFSIDLSATKTSNSTYTDLNDSNDSSFMAGNIFDGADVGVEMTLNNPGNHFIGQIIQYDVEVNNYGFNTSINTKLNLDTTGLINTSFSGCVSASTVSCELGSLLNNSSRNITVSGELADIVFDAEISVSSDLVDINLENNLDNIGNRGAVQNSDITVVASQEINGPYYSYGYMQFGVKVSTGSQPASNIRVWEYYPGAEFISCSGGFWNFLGYCEVASIPANSSHFVYFDYFNPITTSSAQENIEFWSFAEPGEIDVDLSDNESAITMPIEAVSDMAAQLTLVTPPPYYNNQEIQFNLRIVNGGVNNATGVQADFATNNLELVWSTGDLCAGLPCELTQLDRFNEDNIILVYRILEVGNFELIAGTEADQDDPNENNNIDSISGTAEQGQSDLIFADSFETTAGN